MLLVWLFEDKRATVACMCAWLLLVATGCYVCGVSDNKFLQFGPSASTAVLGVRIDTWGKWATVAVFAFVNTCMNEFFGNSLEVPRPTAALCAAR
jgi:hypothetical protein